MALALGVSALVLGAGQAKAGFTGDSVTVSLTVHTTGAVDQDVFSNDPAVVGAGIELTGTSEPNGTGYPLDWSVDLDDLSILLTVSNPGGVATTVDPLVLTVSGLDSDTLVGATIGALNDFGFSNGDLAVGVDFVTLSVPGSVLAILGAGGTLQTQINLAVPEASSVIMTMMAGLMGGGYLWRRRRSIKA
jgi:hypothetical protein